MLIKPYELYKGISTLTAKVYKIDDPHIQSLLSKIWEFLMGDQLRTAWVTPQWRRHFI
jgi:hypothetical protein